MEILQDKKYQRLMRALAKETELDVFDERAVAQAAQKMAKRGPKAQEKLRKDVAAIWERYEREMQAIN